MNQSLCLVPRKLSQNQQTKFFQNFQNLGKNQIFFSKIEKYFFLNSIQNCLKRILNQKSWNRFCRGDPGDRSIFSSKSRQKAPSGPFVGLIVAVLVHMKWDTFQKDIIYYLHYNHSWFWWHCCRFQQIFVIFWRFFCRFSKILRWVLAKTFLKIITS